MSPNGIPYPDTASLKKPFSLKRSYCLHTLDKTPDSSLNIKNVPLSQVDV